MTAEIERLLDKNLTGRIIAAFYAVYNKLGYGFLENVYIAALCLEFQKRGILYEREVSVRVYYDGEPIALYRADIIVEKRILVEVKANATLVQADERQLLNYLRATNIEVGLLLHFGPKPEFRRRVWTKEQFNSQS